MLGSCVPAGEEAPLAARLPHGLAFRCGNVGVFSDSSRALVGTLGYPVANSLTSPSSIDALRLCALDEPPLEAGDSVIRLLVSPGWWNEGMSYVVRIQAKGSRTELEARVLGSV